MKGNEVLLLFKQKNQEKYTDYTQMWMKAHECKYLFSLYSPLIVTMSTTIMISCIIMAYLLYSF
jgi:hypothetical protein